MARPSRCRRICVEPEYDSFAPCGGTKNGQILLAVDEYEVIWLIDYEKRTHAQCAKQMGISRTTVTEIYERARSKIADCIVNGKELRISGGNYCVCDGSVWRLCGRKCHRAQGIVQHEAESGKGANAMRIAVTYENGTIFQHFGHTEQFKLYDVTDGQIVETQVVNAAGSGHGALAGFLTGLQVDTLICGGIGAGAQNALAQAGITLYGGVSGSADEAVNALLAGNLACNPNVRCSHHGHEHHGEGHSCGADKHGCSGSGGSCH